MEENFVKRLKTVLYPVPYTNEIAPAGSFDFLLVRDSGMPGGKYAFAFKSISSRPLRDQFSEAKLEAKKLTNARWLFREVGLYIVLCGSRALWKDRADDFSADRTGLHNIIVQAIHFIDPQTRESHLSKSSWGNLEFGGVESIASVVENVLETPKPPEYGGM